MFGTLLALRGSKVKPGNLPDALEDQADASQKLDVAKSNLNRAYHTVSELERVGERYSNEELQEIVHDLKMRVHELEAREKEATKQTEVAGKTVNRTLKQFAAGGLAGAIARTCVAPIDRVKILMQTQYVTLGEGAPPKYTSISQTLKTVLSEEGPTRLWRGNLTNIFRVVPYSATQFTSYDIYKKMILDNTSGTENLTIPQRLASGALAGCTATTVTYPLDVARLRLAVQPELKGTRDAIMSVYKEGGFRTFYKGYVPTCLSLGPFISVNFAAFDVLKHRAYPDPETKKNPLVVLCLGAAAGIFAQTCCYPLDTVRRRMQMKGRIYTSTPNAFATIFKQEGPLGFYKGMMPNVVKVVPNNAIRFLAFEFLKTYMGVVDTKRR